MAATRKLQGEIERCLKKVAEGVETFEDIWTKVSHAANSNQKEKHEADLKKEIKKLQRLRDQIKTWQASAEVKDKTSLIEHRKLIETQMERFKGLERETKTKAYSKEGLGAAVKLDPAQKQRDDCTRWLSNSIEQLNVQIDQFEAEMDGLAVKKKRDRDKSERLDSLKHWIERHRFHIKKLETLLRMLDNDAVDTDAVQKIREDVEYYTESNQEPDFDENEYIYCDISMDNVDEVFINDVGMMEGSRGDDQSETTNSLHSGSSPTPLNSTSANSTTSVPAAAAAHSTDSHTSEESNKRTRRSISDDGSTSTNSHKSRHSSKQQQQQQSHTSSSAAAAAAAVASSSSHSSKTSTTCTSRSVAALDSHGAPNFAAVAAATSHTALSASHPGHNTSSSVSVASVTSSASSSTCQRVVSSSCASTSSSSPSALPSSSSSSCATSSTTAVTCSPATSPAAAAVSAAVVPSSGSCVNNSAAVVRLLQQHQVNGDKSLDALAVSKALSQQHQNSSSSSSSTMDQHRAATSTVTVSLSSCTTAVSLSTTDNPAKPATTLETRIPTLYSVAPLGPVPMTKEHNYQFQMLQAAFYHMPHPSDSERLRTYLPRNPYPTPPYLPQVPPAGSDSFEFFMKLSVETLFFIFYYMEGTKAQYLAAKSLKKQSWRFHTKYMMWFQRHDEPKLITDEFEQGTYIFFDFEKWTQRRKEGFKFEYKFLEDRDLN